MRNSKIRESLAAALPFKAAKQSKASELTFPNIYAWDSVPTVQNSGGAEDSSNLAQVLQSTLKEASDAVTQNNKRLTDLQAVQQQLLASTGQNTQALNANTTAKGGSASGVLTSIGNVASGLFGQGSILSPIASGIMSLFRGSASTQQSSFTSFIAPPSIQLETAISSVTPPAVQPPNAAVPRQGGQAPATSGPIVQIQVNAMDSRSFIDHSSEIADAVRQALLNSHSLGDVIAEL